MWELVIILTAFNFLRVVVGEVGSCRTVTYAINAGVGGVVLGLLLVVFGSSS